MATSGVYSFNQTRDEIIKDALTILNVIGINESAVSASENSFAARALNRLIKAWMAKDMPLWERKEGVLFLQNEQTSYDIGPTSTDKLANSYVTALTTAAASAAATSIVVDSVTGMSATQNIGIVLSTGTIQWTTISSISTLTIHLGAALTASVADGARVFVCTAGIQRPLRIIDARYHSDGDDLDIAMTQLNHVPYNDLAMKTLTSSYQSMFYYDKQLTNGKLYLWPAPSDVTKVVKFTYHNPLQDFNASTDNADFPVEWLDALIYNLAANLAPVYSMYMELPGLLQLAQAKYQDAVNFNVEDGDIKIQPNTRGY